MGRAFRLNVQDFYALRFANRLLSSALLVVLSALHATPDSRISWCRRKRGLGRAWIAALTFHVNVLEARRGYLPGNWDVLWSLSIEEMFYLFSTCF